jgi:hypothetical protein
MFCRKCGADMPEDSQFCLKCGVSVVVPSVISISPSGTATGVAPALEPNAAAKTSGQPIGTLSSPSTPGTTGNSSTGHPSDGLRLAADKSSLTEPARTAPLEHEIQVRAKRTWIIKFVRITVLIVIALVSLLCCVMASSATVGAGIGVVQSGFIYGWELFSGKLLAAAFFGVITWACWRQAIRIKEGK